MKDQYRTVFDEKDSHIMLPSKGNGKRKKINMQFIDNLPIIPVVFELDYNPNSDVGIHNLEQRQHFASCHLTKTQKELLLEHQRNGHFYRPDIRIDFCEAC